MWKWTDFSNWNTIILDLDSLEKKFADFPFKKYENLKNLIKVRQSKIAFVENEIDVISYLDVKCLLKEVLDNYDCDSSTIIAISGNHMFLKEMMQNHIGTILAGEMKKDFLKHTPDFTIYTERKLDEILKGNCTGYGAEVFATYNCSKGTMSLLKCNNEILLDDGSLKNVIYVFGGRYFSTKHQYILNDPLSTVILNFKNHYVQTVDLFFDSSIKFIREKIDQNIDIVTYIPLKPNDYIQKKYDRFQDLKLKDNAEAGYFMKKLLKCNMNFSQKGNDLEVRKEIVKGAFSLEDGIEIKGKNIIIVDDVFATGSTMEEAVKTLYENGANKVYAIILSVNQLTESINEFKNLKCPICNCPMVLNTNRKSGKLFFGCQNYLNHNTGKITYDVNEGLYKIKNLNKFDSLEILDLDDEY